MESVVSEHTCGLYCCAVVAGMQELLEVRAADDQRDVGARITKTVRSWLPAFDITKAANSSSNSGASSTRPGL